jgi:hypothetical protein
MRSSTALRSSTVSEFESYDAISLFPEPKLPFVISSRDLIVVVMTSVEFDDEAFGGAEKIHNVGTNRRLSPEVRAAYREFAQSTPQNALVRRRVGA